MYMANEVEKFLNEVNGNNALGEQNENPFKDMKFNSEEEDGDQKKEEGQKEEGAEEEEEESKVAFHKNPKIQRFIQKEIAKATRGMTPRATEAVKEAAEGSKSSDDLIAAFTNIIGNDTPEKVHALNMLQNSMKTLEEKATAGTRQLEASQRAQAEAEETLNEGLESIEDTYNVDLTSTDPKARKLRGEFLEFVERIAPKDQYGQIKDYPDFEEAFDLFNERRTKPKTDTKAKELAARGMGRSADASKIPDNQGSSWKDVERFFSKLQKNNN